jgi:molybdopterin-containing oxidoreductase family membrane subunit
MIVIIIGGQAYPLVVFPGKVVNSGFFDGVVGSYTPSFPELTLGVSGLAIGLFLLAVALKIFCFLPSSLADKVVFSGSSD